MHDIRAINWLFTLQEHEYETDDFMIDLTELDRSDILALRPVMYDFLIIAPHMIRMVDQRDRNRMKSVIAFLTELHERQTREWLLFQHEIEERLFEIRSIIHSPNAIELTRKWALK